MAMKMTSQASASARDAGRTDGPAEVASSLIVAGPRVLAIRTSTPALPKRVASAEPMFPVPTMAYRVSVGICAPGVVVDPLPEKLVEVLTRSSHQLVHMSTKPVGWSP